ncbi:hypothetical protein CHARACLAT_008180 [Characodon lateralis]|uniref:Uncharacterized protein n=1 Tax=Characodon lateralis TaxID=208331 RepID=A0ABU7EHJ0_9TELE|nr:hypothetical protein [Characodon lateralis]
MPGTLPDPTMPGSSAVLMPMERQMSLGSNMMGMQSPAHSNSCSSTHVPSMHSEAKLLAHTAPVPQCTTRASGPGRIARLRPSRLSLSGTTRRLCSDQLGPEPE